MLRAFRPAFFLAISLASASALAQSPWNGTWKLDQSKSHMTGTTYTLSKSGNMYHYKGAAVDYDFACDGKDYPIFQGSGRTVSCHDTPTSLDTTVKQNGKIVATIQRRLEPGGNRYSMIRTRSLPGGGTAIDKSMVTRVGQGSGIIGTWKMTSTTSNTPDVMILKVNGNTMSVEEPNSHQTWEGKLDGTPAPDRGPNVPNGIMITRKSEGPRKIVSDVSIGGKLVNHFEDTLSADGKSITEVDWAPSRTDEKHSYFYEKQ